MKYRFIESVPYTGKDLRNIRMEKSMTQKEMAEYLGVSKKAVEAWEYGENPPTGPVRRLLDILQCSDISDLPFAVEKEDAAISFIVNAAKHSRGNKKHWMRYLRKLFNGEDARLTEEQIQAVLTNEQLDFFQKVSLKRAVTSGSPTNRYVIGLNRKAKPVMLEEVKKNVERRKSSLSETQ